MKNLRVLFVGVIFLMSLNSYGQFHKKNKDKDNEQNKQFQLTNASDSIFYCLGLDIANNFKDQGLTPFNPVAYIKAVETVYNGEYTLIPRDSAIRYIQKYFQALYEKKGKENKAAGEKFLSDNKFKPGVITTKSGLQYLFLKLGTGPKPNRENYITVHYTGQTIDGIVFDSSYEKKPTQSMPVGGQIPGWTEALQLMNAGSRIRIFVPYNLAYYDRGPSPKVGPYSTLIYDIELLSIDK